jgi:hypothetical protein
MVDASYQVGPSSSDDDANAGDESVAVGGSLRAIRKLLKTQSNDAWDESQSTSAGSDDEDAIVKMDGSRVRFSHESSDNSTGRPPKAVTLPSRAPRNPSKRDTFGNTKHDTFGKSCPNMHELAESRVLQDESGGRQMFDKNTLRTSHRDAFVNAISQLRSQQSHVSGPQTCQAGTRDDSVGQGAAVQVYVRKRPLFEHEQRQNGDFDVTTICPGKPVPKQVVIHNCLFQADLKTPLINSLTFDFDHVWDSDAENADVYRSAAAPLVKYCLEGGASTMFMFGQTGSGKTFTMSAIHRAPWKSLL